MMSFEEVVKALEEGRIRVAEKTSEGWKVNAWVKEAILEGFRKGKLTDMSKEEYSFFDKDTLPLRKFSLEDKVRIVPGGSSVRTGAYLAPSVIMMPPSYVNIGAYVDSGTMVDSHALVGSCAQIGKNVHISAASQIGGVLEPAGALPVIVEDNAFIGGNCGIYEGTISSGSRGRSGKPPHPQRSRERCRNTCQHSGDSQVQGWQDGCFSRVGNSFKIRCYKSFSNITEQGMTSCWWITVTAV